MSLSPQTAFFVKNPEAHVLALAADGFKEQTPKKRLSSWPTRYFVKVHKKGLLTETQHIDMSRAPLDAISGDHQATVEVALKINRNALKRLTEQVKKMFPQKAEKPCAMTAFLSEYRTLIERLNHHSFHIKNSPKITKEIDDFLLIVRQILPRI